MASRPFHARLIGFLLILGSLLVTLITLDVDLLDAGDFWLIVFLYVATLCLVFRPRDVWRALASLFGRAPEDATERAVTNLVLDLAQAVILLGSALYSVLAVIGVLSRIGSGCLYPILVMSGNGFLVGTIIWFLLKLLRPAKLVAVDTIEQPSHCPVTAFRLLALLVILISPCFTCRHFTFELLVDPASWCLSFFLPMTAVLLRFGWAEVRAVFASLVAREARIDIVPRQLTMLHYLERAVISCNLIGLAIALAAVLSKSTNPELAIESLGTGVAAVFVFAANLSFTVLLLRLATVDVQRQALGRVPLAAANPAQPIILAFAAVFIAVSITLLLVVFALNVDADQKAEKEREARETLELHARPKPAPVGPCDTRPVRRPARRR